jgi:hypothetical protein
MTDLREMLRDRAAEVAGYDVAGSVLRTARRRRRLRRAAPLAAMLAVLGTVATALVATRDGGDVPVIAADRPALTGGVAWLPAELAAGAQPPPLPADRPVGAGALVYATCDVPCGARLVTADGKQFQLPAGRGEPEVPRVSTLSPDGRWLSYPDPDGNYLLRDLTGGQSLSLGPRRVVRWSWDGRWAVLADARTERDLQVVAPPDLAAAVPGPPAGEHGGQLAGLTSDGAAVFIGDEAHEVGAPADLRRVGRDGTEHRVRLGTAALHGHGDDPAADRGVLVADDSLLVQLMTTTGREGLPGDLARADARTGEVRDRYRLPAPRAGAGGAGETGPGGGGFRVLAAIQPEGAILTTYRNGVPAAIELLDLGSGDRTIITTVPGAVTALKVRGQA